MSISTSEFRALAELRFRLRSFLAFSEAQARSVGLEPHQHQLLLALHGLPADTPPTIGAVAARMVLRHHTVVGLVDRLERAGLVRRGRATGDRRQVSLKITRRGQETLRRLSIAHRDELALTAPALVKALRHVLRSA